MCRIHLVLNVKIIEWCESSRQFSLLVTTPVEPKYTRPGAHNSQQRQVHVVVRSVQQDYESYICMWFQKHVRTINNNKNEKFILYLRLINRVLQFYNTTGCPFFFLLPSNINPPRGDFHTSPLLVSPVPCCFRPCR